VQDARRRGRAGHRQEGDQRQDRCSDEGEIMDEKAFAFLVTLVAANILSSSRLWIEK
jgi:hypothetical protein